MEKVIECVIVTRQRCLVLINSVYRQCHVDVTRCPFIFAELVKFLCCVKLHCSPSFAAVLPWSPSQCSSLCYHPLHGMMVVQLLQLAATQKKMLLMIAVDIFILFRWIEKQLQMQVLVISFVDNMYCTGQKHLQSLSHIRRKNQKKLSYMKQTF